MSASAMAAWTRAQFGAFIAEAVNPGARERDQRCRSVPKELVRRAGALGLLRLSVDRCLDGAPLDMCRWGHVQEELGYLCHDMGFLLLLNTRTAVARAIAESGQNALSDLVVPAMAVGELEGCFAYTDDGDAFCMATRARRTPDGWRLTGVKSMVTGAETGDVFMVYATNEDRETMVFLVDRGTAGLSVRPVETMGCRSAGMGALCLDDVRVPDARVLIRSDGVSHAQAFLSRRAELMAGPVGMARRLFDESVAALRARQRFGRALADFDSVQAAVGRMRVAIESSRWALQGAYAQMPVQPAEGALTSSLAKYFVAEQLLSVARMAQSLLGGEGYASAAGFERYARDFAALIAGAGSQLTLEANIGLLSMSHLGRTWRWT